MLVCQTFSVLLLPLLFDVDGIWYAITAAEIFATTISVIFLFAKRKSINICKYPARLFAPQRASLHFAWNNRKPSRKAARNVQEYRRKLQAARARLLNAHAVRKP